MVADKVDSVEDAMSSSGTDAAVWVQMYVFTFVEQPLSAPHEQTLTRSGTNA